MSRALARPLGVMAVLWVSAASTATGQSLTGGAIHGIVRDGAGARVPDASITVRDAASGASRSATAGTDGRFAVPALPPGEFEVFIERFGYRPQRVTGVPVRPGRRLDLVIVLELAPPPVDSVAEFRYGAAGLGGSRAGESQWFSGFEFGRLPDQRRELTDLARWATVSSAELATEGLPASLSGLLLDGVPYSGARHPELGSAALRGAAFPLSAFERAELVTNGIDVEWSGFAGGVLSAHSRRGTRAVRFQSFGSWTGDALWSSKYVDGDALGHNALRGGFLLSGPIIRDTAQFTIGLEGWRLEAPQPRAWELESAGAALVPAAQSAYGVDLRPYLSPRVVRTEALTGFSRFDWQIAPEHALAVRASFSSLPTSELESGAGRAPSPGAAVEGEDLAAAATLTSGLGARLVQEIRFGLETSERRHSVDGDDAPRTPSGTVLPGTRVVAGGLAFGADPALPGQFRRSAVHASQALQLQAGAHRLKFGVAASFASFEDSYAYARNGEFVFGGVEQFARREGSFVQATGTLPVARFNRPQYALFLQDAWNSGPGFDLTVGVRVESEHLPQDRVILNREWLRLTGLANAAMPARRTKFSPRIGFTWDVQERNLWLLRGGAGVYYDQVDPAVLAEVLTFDGTIRMRRGLGELSAWPALPDTLSAPYTGARLALLGPDFEAPRSSRASIGATRLLGAESAVHLSAAFRRTEFLPRRADLNLSPAPLATDQHGRPVYGELVQQGGLIAAVPGSNRRFSDFDQVSALNPDGRSEYWGLSVALEHRTAGALRLFGRYTYSSTTDNWLMGRGGPDGQLSPFPDSLNGRDWAEGRSDFDVPHRLAAGAEIALDALGGVAIAGAYRFRSGYPFTPGFRDGVDVNGDGSGRNDPAFVDDDVPGTDALLREFDCLRSQVGRFAERNACRAPGVHSLDARLTVGVARLGNRAAELVVDALNLLESDVAQPDGALYLVDPTRGLGGDQAAGSIVLPLNANPNFGQPLVRRTAGRTLRVGFRVSY